MAIKLSTLSVSFLSKNRQFAEQIATCVCGCSWLNPIKLILAELSDTKRLVLSQNCQLAKQIWPPEGPDNFGPNKFQKRNNKDWIILSQ
jgi:hypothetical protein